MQPSLILANLQAKYSTQFVFIFPLQDNSKHYNFYCIRSSSNFFSLECEDFNMKLHYYPFFIHCLFLEFSSLDLSSYSDLIMIRYVQISFAISLEKVFQCASIFIFYCHYRRVGLFGRFDCNWDIFYFRRFLLHLLDPILFGIFYRK